MKGAGRHMINLTACRKIKTVCRKKKMKETSARIRKYLVCFRCGLRRGRCLPGKCLPFKQNLRKARAKHGSSVKGGEICEVCSDDDAVAGNLSSSECMYS